MAEIGNTFPTLIDVLARVDDGGKMRDIFEVLAQQNPILQDATYVQANNGTRHRTTVRAGIPEPAYRRFNAGVPNLKTTVATVEDTTGMLQAYSVVDKDLADISGAPDAYRASEAKGIMQGFNNKVARDIFYGSTRVTPEGFMGLAPRYSSLTADNGSQIVDGGGTGSTNASIWFITWGERSTQLIYPKGTAAGLQHRDHGEVTVEDAAGLSYQAYRDFFSWHIGLTDRDWMGNARIANVDVNALTKDAATGADILDLMTEATGRLNTGLVNEGKTVIYVPRKIRSFLMRQVRNSKNVQLTYENVLGLNGTSRQELHFDGFPVRQVDVLVSNEARVV